MTRWLVFALVVSAQLLQSILATYAWNVSVIDNSVGSEFDDEFKLQTALDNEMQKDLLKITGTPKKLDPYLGDFGFEVSTNGDLSNELANLSPDTEVNANNDEKKLPSKKKRKKVRHKLTHKHDTFKKSHDREKAHTKIKGKVDQDDEKLENEGAELVLKLDRNQKHHPHKEKSDGDEDDDYSGERVEKEKIKDKYNELQADGETEADEEEDDKEKMKDNSKKYNAEEVRHSDSMNKLCKARPHMQKVASIDAQLESAEDEGEEEEEEMQEEDEEDEEGERKKNGSNLSKYKDEDDSLQEENDAYHRDHLSDDVVSSGNKEYPPVTYLQTDKLIDTSIHYDDVAILKDFVGTNIFANHNKRCFSTEDIALLSARKDFERLIPKNLPKSLLSDDSISLLMNYFYACHRIISRMTNNYSKGIAQKAYYDTIGGYLNWYLVPVTKYSFYAGRVSLQSAQNIIVLHKQCKNFLNVNGNGWRPPLNDILHKLKDVQIEPLHLDQDANEPSFCMHLDLNANQYENVNEGLPNPLFASDNYNDDAKLLVALPQLDAEDRNTFLGNIWLPFKRRRTFDLRSDNSAYIVVKFYETVTKCHQYQHLSQDLYNRKFRTWIRENVEVHLPDEEFYPGLGAILRVYEKLKGDEKAANLYGDHLIGAMGFVDDDRSEHRQKKHSVNYGHQIENNHKVSKGWINKIYGKDIFQPDNERELTRQAPIAGLNTFTFNKSVPHRIKNVTTPVKLPSKTANNPRKGIKTNPRPAAVKIQTTTEDPTDDDLLREDEKCKEQEDIVYSQLPKDFNVHNRSRTELSTLSRGLLDAIDQAKPISYIIMAVPVFVVLGIITLCLCRRRVGKVTEKAPTAKGKRMKRASKVGRRIPASSSNSDLSRKTHLLPDSNTSLMSGSTDNITCSPRRRSQKNRSVIETTSLDYTSSDVSSKRTPPVSPKAPSNSSNPPSKSSGKTPPNSVTKTQSPKSTEKPPQKTIANASPKSPAKTTPSTGKPVKSTKTPPPSSQKTAKSSLSPSSPKRLDPKMSSVFLQDTPKRKFR